MEPRSWKWIQGAVIAAVMAISLAAAVWYENRPVDTSIPAVAAVPTRKTVLHSSHPDVFPNVAPDKTGVGASKIAGTAAATDTTDSPTAVPVPSQSSVNSWQKHAVDPMARLSFPPATRSGTTGTAAAFPGVPTGVSPDSGSVAASPTASGSSAASPPFLPGATASPAVSSPGVSPFVNTAPTAVGGPSVPAVSPFTGPSPAAPNAVPGL